MPTRMHLRTIVIGGVLIYLFNYITASLFFLATVNLLPFCTPTGAHRRQSGCSRPNPLCSTRNSRHHRHHRHDYGCAVRVADARRAGDPQQWAVQHRKPTVVQSLLPGPRSRRPGARPPRAGEKVSRLIEASARPVHFFGRRRSKAWLEGVFILQRMTQIERMKDIHSICECVGGKVACANSLSISNNSRSSAVEKRSMLGCQHYRPRIPVLL